MAETLSLLSVISFALAGVSFVVAIVFWIYFKIPTVIGDLSGRSAKKSIARMRASNEKTGNKAYRPSETNIARGKLTGRMQKEGSTKANPNNTAATRDAAHIPETSLLAENRAGIHSESTALLESTNETDLLEETHREPAKRVGGVKLTMIDEVILVHTEEVIK